MEVLRFILDSWWNTFAVLLFASLFRPIRISRSIENIERKNVINGNVSKD